MFLKSLNGVFVNGRQILPDAQQEIEPGDHICFGAANENNIHEFDYSFELVPCARKRKLESGDLQQEPKVRKILKESDDNSVKSENVPGPSGENRKVC